jgi:hypothetical protein
VSAVPKPLLGEVRAIVRDQRLQPVAVLRTTRTEQHLLGTDDTELAVVADDTVRAERHSDGQSSASSWREVEVELTGGDRDLLAAVAPLLTQAGFTPSMSSSKLAHVLGDPQPETSPRPEGRPGKARTVGGALLGYLGEEVGELVARDPAAARTSRTGCTRCGWPPAD